MKKIFLALLCAAMPAFASTTTVTATVVDTDSQVWAYGKWTATLTFPYGSNVAPSIGGVGLTSTQTTVTGILDGAGNLSATLTDTSSLDQPGASWSIKVCPYASGGCYTVSTTITGASVSLSPQLGVVPAPRFPAGPSQFGYNDTEVLPTSTPGITYYNVITGLRAWNDIRKQWEGSGTRDILDPGRPTGTYASTKNENVAVSSAATLNLLNYAGGQPGYIDSLFIALSGTGNTDQSTINIYYEGSSTATISIPFRNLCMSVYLTGGGGASFLINDLVQANATKSNGLTSCAFKLPIPFSSQVKVDIVNASGQSENVWSYIEYQTGVPNTWLNTRHLHIDATNISGVAANTVTTLMNYSGSAGRFVGLFMMDDEVPGSVSPKGAPLEGNLKFFFDGATTAQMEASGTEDYFGFGFYFGASNEVQFAGTTSVSGNVQQISAGGFGDRGVTFVGATAYSTQGAYRLHLRDKRNFSSGLKITIPCGDTSQLSFTGTCTQFWTAYYYTAN